MQRKVDAMNKIPPKGASQGGSAGVAKTAQEGQQSWWGKKKQEEKVWFLYVTLMMIAVTVSYAVEHIVGASEEHKLLQYFIAGGIVLFVLHTVIWPFFTSKTSNSTKWIVSSVLIFYSGTLVFPEFVSIRDHGWSITKKGVTAVDKALASVDEGIGITSSTTKTNESSSSSQQLEQTLNLYPNDEFQKADWPYSKIVEKSQYTCSRGCIVEIVHEGRQLCWNNKYIYKSKDGEEKMIRCGVEVDGYTSHNIPILREQFEELKGVKVFYPKTLTHAILSFGTTDAIGPSEVKLTTIISD